MTPHELSHPLLPLLRMRAVDTKKGSDASEVSSYNTLAISIMVIMVGCSV